MITIDHDRCNLCKECIEICHEYCMSIENQLLSIDFKYCSTCCQCIAICQEQALSWEKVVPAKFDKINYPGPIQINELLRERRTIRDFTNVKIDRALLEQIVNNAKYAPTHNFNFKAIIIDEPEVIENIDEAIYRFTKRLYRFVYKLKIIHQFVKITAPKFEFEYLKAKPKLEKSIQRGRAFKTLPAAIILIVGEKSVPFSLESAQYGLYNIDLYAQSLGLGCRNLVGNQMILNRSRRIRKLLRLSKQEKIFGTIAIGHPAVRFRNKVNGKQMIIQWN
jgi:nitroreductase/NAD-dependent dihydropyrimidine dehydrogenase PreA subunit